MEKAQLPLIAELDLGDTEHPTAKTACRFTGTDNPRHRRVISALLTRPRKREEIDRIAGASNGPDLVAELRRRGLSIRCRLVPGIDRDGNPVKFGVYALDDEDRRKVKLWLRTRDAKVRSTLPSVRSTSARGVKGSKTS